MSFNSYSEPEFVKLKALLKGTYYSKGLKGMRSLKKQFDSAFFASHSLSKLPDTINEVDLKALVRKLEKELKIVDPASILSTEEINKIFRLTDTKNVGYIFFEQLIQAMKGPIEPDRAILVEVAYHKLDRDNKGYISGKDIKHYCKRTVVPEVASREKSVNVYIFEFFRVFDGEKDLRVTKDKFYNYYLILNYLIDSDSQFEDGIINEWFLTAEEVQAYVASINQKQKKLSMVLQPIVEGKVSSGTLGEAGSELNAEEAAHIRFLSNSLQSNSPSPPMGGASTAASTNSARKQRAGGGGSRNMGSSFSSDMSMQSMQGIDLTDELAVNDAIDRMPYVAQVIIFTLGEKNKALIAEKEMLQARIKELEAHAGHNNSTGGNSNQIDSDFQEKLKREILNSLEKSLVSQLENIKIPN